MIRIKGNLFTFPGVYDVRDCQTSEEVMQKANLNWSVKKAPVFAKMDGAVDFENNSLQANEFFHGSDSYKHINNAFCTYRTDINYPLGMVKDRYTPVQNIEAFKFFDDVIGKNEVSWFTAGCKNNGTNIFVSAKLRDNILINGKDPIDTYLVFSTSHDGSSGLRIMLTPIRLVCFNCMNSAIKRSSNYITLRHTKTINNRINEATEILQISKKKIVEFGEAMEQMCKIKFDDKQALELFGQTILNDKELERLALSGFKLEHLVRKNWYAMEAADVSTQKVNQLNEIIEYYNVGPGQREYLGTGYGIYNAVNGYFSNCKSDEGFKRMDNLLTGNYSNKIKEIGDLILN